MATSAGTTLVYTYQGAIHATLPSTVQVTALSLSASGVLAVGYATGGVLVYSIPNSRAISTLSNHTTPITHLHSIAPSPSSPADRVLSCSADGVTHLSSCSSNFLGVASATAQCLLDGSAGTLLDVVVLAEWCCLVSRRSCFVVGLDEVKVLNKWPLDFAIVDADGSTSPPSALPPADSSKPTTSTLPRLTWSRVPIPGQRGATYPLLCRGHGDILSFLSAEAMTDDDGDGPNDDPGLPRQIPAFGVVKTMTLDFLSSSSSSSFSSSSSSSSSSSISDVCYLTPTRLAVFTSRAQLLLYSTLTFTLLATVNLPSPSYTLHQLPSSSGLAMMSTSPSSNALYTISPTSTVAVADALVNNGEWLNALSFVCRDYISEVLVVNTSHKRSALKREVSDILESHQYFADPNGRGAARSDGSSSSLKYIANYIEKYVELGLTHVPSNDPSSHYAMVFTVATHYCCYTNSYDLLYTALHPSPADGGLDEYHNAIVAAILSNMLRYVNPAAMVPLVDYAAAKLSSSKLSRIILSIDVRVIPYDHLIRLAKSKNLTTAMAYILTEGLGDYKTAVKESLKRDAGVGLFVIECCVKGVTFPHGREMGATAGVGKERGECVRECIEAVMEEEGDGSSLMKFCCEDIVWWCDLLGEIFANYDDEDANPSLSAAGRDSHDRLDASSSRNNNNANTSNSNTNSNSKNDDGDDDDDRYRRHRQSIAAKRIPTEAIMDTFYSTVVEQMDNSFDCKLQFARFLAERISDKSVVPGSLSAGMITAALEVLLSTGDTTYSNDIVLVLGSVDESLYDMNAVHDAAAKHGFWRVCGSMNSSVGDIRSVVLYYLKDADVEYRKKALASLREARSSEREGLVPSPSTEILLEFLPELVSLHAAETARLVGELFFEARERVMTALEQASATMKYLFVREVVQKQEKEGKEEGEEEKRGISALYATLALQDFHDHAVATRANDPESLHDFLYDNSGKYTPEVLYPVVKGVYDAEALLLSKMGSGDAAVDVVMKETERRFNGLKMAVRQSQGGESGKSSSSKSGKSSKSSSSSLSSLGENNHSSSYGSNSRILSPSRKDAGVRKAEEETREALRVAIKIVSDEEDSGGSGSGSGKDSSSNSSSSSSNTDVHRKNHGRWFKILDRLLNLKNIITVTAEAPDNVVVLKSIYAGLMRLLMNNLVEHTNSASLVEKLCGAGNRLGEFRDVLKGILEGYKGDVEICANVENVMLGEETDLAHVKLGKMKRGERVAKKIVEGKAEDRDKEEEGEEEEAKKRRREENAAKGGGGGGGGGGSGSGGGKRNSHLNANFSRRRNGVKNSWLRSRNETFEIEGGKRLLLAKGNNKAGVRPTVISSALPQISQFSGSM